MKLLNYTDRDIQIIDTDGITVLLRLERLGISPQVNTNQVVLETVNGIEVVTYEYSNVIGLPDPEDGVMFVVNWAVLQALNGSRPDVISPDTSPTSVIKRPMEKTVNGVKKTIWEVYGVRKFRKL